MVRPFSLHASHGPTIGLSLLFARMQGGGRKFKVVAVEGVQGCAVEKVHEEVETCHEEVPRRSHVTCSQYFFGKQQFHLWDSLHHDNTLLSDLFNNGTHNLQTQPCGSERRPRHERPTTHTHTHSRRTASQESGDGKPKPRRKTANRRQRPTGTKAQHPILPKHFPRARTKPSPQGRLLTSMLC